MTYADYQTTNAPTWLRRAWGVGWTFVMGTVKDGVLEGAKVAVKARFSQVCSPDALPYLLRDFALDPPYNEAIGKTRARLAAAWATWKYAGTPRGLIGILNVAGFGNVTIQENVTAGRWWDFRVLLRPPFPWDSSLVPTARWGDGWRWGAGYRWRGAYPADVDKARVLALIRKWKPTHANASGVVAQLAGPYWGEFSWGDGTAYGGTENQWS